ncbi:hypothetical protein MHSN_01370 [Metamycoplasma hyosynoviae]|uniref:Type I restriction modification DNA specificity domain-containing protein n=1 Tax=Metamycoplasma hyosynoviae TaxID=29559 RepID=A0A4P1QG52_9BACT|nr:restriction endonuclease subunit S [Metamycoplasma hyosynoviae]ASI53851.1 hypothetical protein MHSN_01370 [Metamycoplasma hyosynoviae]
MANKKLNDICININDGTHSTVIDDENGSSYLLSCKNIKGGKIFINDNDRKINNNTFLQIRKRTKTEYKDVVITKIGTVGQSACINDLEPNYEFQCNVAILKPNNSIILSEYLNYFFHSNTGKISINTRIKGAAQPCLFLNDLKDIDIFVPDLQKQHHIVNIIGSVDNLIENYQERINKICNILFISLKKYTEKISIKYYEPKIIKSGITKFDKTKIYIDTSKIEGINNMSNGNIITFNKRPSRANMQPIKNSVWFAKMKESNKKLIITENDFDLINDYILSTGYLGVEASSKIPLSLLLGIIISSDFNEQRDLNSVGTTMAGINNETFLNILVPKLSDDEILKYDKNYHSFINELSLLRKKINELRVIKSKLLEKYF